jgi:hypothetical protein
MAGDVVKEPLQFDQGADVRLVTVIVTENPPTQVWKLVA